MRAVVSNGQRTVSFSLAGARSGQLNEAFRNWLQQSYHPRVHSVTNQTPLERFSSHLECLRPTPSNLEDYFRKRTLRIVAKDRTVALNGRLYEAPLL